MAMTALRDQSERSVQVNREKLIETLTTNREKHLRDYEEAKRGYRDTLLSRIDEAFGDAKKSIETKHRQTRESVEAMSDSDIAKQNDQLTLVSAISIQMRVPRCFAKEYDAAIDMAKWDVRETLELSHAEFQCFVRDVWDWTNDFEAVSACYKMRK